MFFKVFLSLYIHVRFYHPKRGCPTARKAGIQVLDSGFSCGFRIPGTWFLTFCQWNLNFVFQLLAGFRIPWAGIRDSNATILDPTNENFPYADPTNKNFLYFRFLKQKHPVLRIPQTKISRIPDPTNKNFLYFRFHKQKHPKFADPTNKKFPVIQIPQTKFSPIADPTNKNFLYFRSHKQKHPVLRIPQAKIYRISDPLNKNFPYSGSHYQNFPIFQIPQTKLLFPIPKEKISRIVDSGLPCLLRKRECTLVVWFISILFFIYSCLW